METTPTPLICRFEVGDTVVLQRHDPYTEGQGWRVGDLAIVETRDHFGRDDGNSNIWINVRRIWDSYREAYHRDAFEKLKEEPLQEINLWYI